MISSFRGEYAFLSNFYQAPIEIPWYGDTLALPDVEHGFQAWKAARQDEAVWVVAAPTAAEAKKRGRQIAPRPNWNEIRREVMLSLLLHKFRQNPELCQRLGGTGDEKLVEGNTWGDMYWGCVQVPASNAVGAPLVWSGENYLGKCLMAVRMVLC